MKSECELNRQTNIMSCRRSPIFITFAPLLISVTSYNEGEVGKKTPKEERWRFPNLYYFTGIKSGAKVVQIRLRLSCIVVIAAE